MDITNKIVLKVNMITFLMTNFSFLKDLPDGVKLFKNNVSDLVNKNQIPFEIKDIIYRIYGIVNTDTYYESRVKLKLNHITRLMSMYQKTDRVNFISIFMSDCESGSISKSVEDIVREIYEIPTKKVQSLCDLSNKNITDFSSAYNKSDATSSETKPNHFGKAKRYSDISRIEPIYLKNAVYRYPNPNFTGCTGSSQYLYALVTECIDGAPEESELFYGIKQSNKDNTFYKYERFEPSMFVSSKNTDSCSSHGFSSRRGC